MGKIGNLEKIVEEFGPHLHDEPHGGWRPNRTIDRIVPTHCPYCAVRCGMNLLVEQNHVVGFEPRYNFPVNEGRLCPKGVTAYLQVYHPDRLLYPLIKRDGMFERSSWDEALDLLVSRFKELQSRHGKDSIGVYSGSSLSTEKTYLMGKFARAGLGTRYVDYNGRLCMVSAAAGNSKAFGIDRAANPWSDIPLAEVLLIAETFPVLNKFLWKQRDMGGRWIVVDRRETPTARQGDIHLRLRPGTDVALANAMLNVLIHMGLTDEGFIAARTNGWAETRELALRYTPQIASEITGVPAEKIVQAARLYGGAKIGRRHRDERAEASLPRLPQLRQCVPVRRAEVQLRHAPSDEVRHVLWPHERGTQAHVRACTPRVRSRSGATNRSSLSGAQGRLTSMSSATRGPRPKST